MPVLELCFFAEGLEKFRRDYVLHKQARLRAVYTFCHAEFTPKIQMSTTS